MSTTLVQGYLRDGPFTGARNTRITSDLESFALVVPPYLSEDISPRLTGTRFPFLISAHRTLKTAKFRRSYFDDYYFRTHMTPNPVAFGNILGDKNIPLSVWNANFFSETITDVVAPTLQGVTITLPTGVTLPAVFTPLLEEFFTATASAHGSPTIRDYFVFTIDGVDVPLLTTGKRLALFPFKPDWNSTVDETFEYDSWVLRAGDGTEQSGSNWGNQPRRHYDFSVSIKRQKVQLLENLLFGRQHLFLGLPLWPEKTKLTTAIVEGDTTFYLDTTDLSFAVGSLAVIWADDENYEAFEITATTSSHVTSGTPAQRDWPLGTRVYPVGAAMVAQSTSGTWESDTHVTMPVSFECDPASTPDNTPIGGSTATYRGEELYLPRIDWASGLSGQYDSDRDAIDMRTGTFGAFSYAGYSTKTRKHNWTVKNHAQARELRAFIGRREGVARPVWMPSGIHDFRLAVDVPNPSATIDVLPNQYAEYVGMADARRDIIFLFRDGTYIARRIIDTLELGGGNLRLTLDGSITRTINESQLKRIAFLELVRFGSNSTTIRWLTDLVGTAEADMIVKKAS